MLRRPSTAESGSDATGIGAALRRVPLGIRYMAAAAFFFSIMSLLVKVAGQRLPPQEMVLARAVVGVALSWYWLRSRGVSPWGHRKGLLLVRGLIGFGGLSAFFFAVTRLPLADVTVIQYTNPVFTAVLAAIFLSERMRPRDVALVLLSLVGVVLMTRPGFLFGGLEERLDPFAVAVALAGAILSAGAYVTVRELSKTEDPVVIVFWFALVATAGSIPFTAAGGLMPTPWEWGALLGIGVVTQLAQVALTRGLKEERAGRAMAVAYMQIVFAAIWGALFFAEYPDLWGLTGALLIVAGTAGIARSRAAS
ncbi:MAG: DMT family transporter [Longimicrobiales bacterium]